MNQKNVEALAALITECEALVSRTESAPLVQPFIARWIAEKLAARGVLVPGALTDDEARIADAATAVDLTGRWDGPETSDNTDFDAAVASAMRAALEGIARGTPPLRRIVSGGGVRKYAYYEEVSGEPPEGERPR